MNKQRILRLAARIEALEHSPDFESVDSQNCFRMDRFHYDCGSPACIAGHAEAMAIAEDVDATQAVDAFALAAHYLGIEPSQAQELFDPRCTIDSPLRAIAPYEAARTLRRLADTGFVDWSVEGDQA